jgi:hypothetical protein
VLVPMGSVGKRVNTGNAPVLLGNEDEGNVEDDGGGENVKVWPSVVIVVGDVTEGMLMVSVPIMMKEPLETTVLPFGSIIVVAAAALLDEDDVGGENVKVWPSVVTVVGDVTEGMVMVSDPMMIIEPLDITVLPLGSIIVVAAALLVVLEDDGNGEKVKVWPSVVIVVGDVTEGTLMVSDPMMIIEPLEITVLPFGSIIVVATAALLEVDEDDVFGENVKVWPSVVIVVGVVTEGMVIVSDPMMMIEPLETTVLPFGSIIVVAAAALLDVDDDDGGGENVKVWPSVVIVVGAVTEGTLMVSDPMMIIEPLEITVLPFGSIIVVAAAALLEVDEDDIGGENVNVWPSVVIVVGVVTEGMVIVSDPMMMIEPLDITVLPFGSIIVVAAAALLVVVVDEDDGAGENVKVWPSVVTVVGAVTEGMLIVSDPMMMKEPLETTVLPLGSMIVVAFGDAVVELEFGNIPLVEDVIFVVVVEFPKGGVDELEITEVEFVILHGKELKPEELRVPEGCEITVVMNVTVFVMNPVVTDISVVVTLCVVVSVSVVISVVVVVSVAVVTSVSVVVSQGSEVEDVDSSHGSVSTDGLQTDEVVGSVSTDGLQTDEVVGSSHGSVSTDVLRTVELNDSGLHDSEFPHGAELTHADRYGEPFVTPTSRLRYTICARARFPSAKSRILPMNLLDHEQLKRWLYEKRNRRKNSSSGI